jgi:hypothetical protein
MQFNDGEHRWAPGVTIRADNLIWGSLAIYGLLRKAALETAPRQRTSLLWCAMRVSTQEVESMLM